jgi:DNA modification methylase
MIEPRYQSDRVTLYCADCQEVLPQLEAGSVDAVVTDPPYGLNDDNGKVSRRNGEMIEFTAGGWDDVLLVDWIEFAVNACASGGWLAVFTDNLSVKTIWDKFISSGANPKQTYYWIKNNPPPQPRDNFCSGIETAVLATKGAVKKWNGGGATVNYYRCPLVSNGERYHPTQKPIQLIKKLVTLFTSANNAILDPFMGSGTTGVACMQTGRKFIGIEIDEGYYQIAEKRIRQAEAQLLLGI